MLLNFSGHQALELWFSMRVSVMHSEHMTGSMIVRAGPVRRESGLLEYSI